MDNLLKPLLDAPVPAVYGICGLLIAAEAALLLGIVLPTLSTLLLMGFLAQHGTLDVRLALAVAIATALTGDQLAYLEGRYWGPLLRRSRIGRLIGPERWARAEAAVAGYGVLAVIAGRCLAGVRTLVPRMAGSAAMPYRRFVSGSACAAVLWASSGILAGYTTATLAP